MRANRWTTCVSDAHADRQLRWVRTVRTGTPDYVLKRPGLQVEGSAIHVWDVSQLFGDCFGRIISGIPEVFLSCVRPLDQGRYKAGVRLVGQVQVVVGAHLCPIDKVRH